MTGQYNAKKTYCILWLIPIVFFVLQKRAITELIQDKDRVNFFFHKVLFFLF